MPLPKHYVLGNRGSMLPDATNRTMQEHCVTLLNMAAITLLQLKIVIQNALHLPAASELADAANAVT